MDRLSKKSVDDRELKIALEEWLKVIPEFHLANEDEIVVRASGVFGIDRLELAW